MEIDFIHSIFQFPRLTHLLLDKMVAILADDIFKWTVLNENGRILNQISLYFLPGIKLTINQRWFR